MSAEQVKKALESHGSVRSVVPYVVEYQLVSAPHRAFQT